MVTVAEPDGLSMPATGDDPEAGAAVAEPGAQLQRLLDVGGRIIAPATLISTLLFYFGYVSSRAQYDYFGLDVDVIGLSTQDYVMRSPQPLLVPLLVLTLVGAGALAAHAAVRRSAARPTVVFLVRRLLVVGVVLLAVGVGLLFGYAALGEWWAYPLLTPLVLAVGGALVAYGSRARRWLDRPRTSAALSGGLAVLLWLTVATSLFWATATVAQWSGRGLAREQAAHLDRLPSVVVDSRQRLFLPLGSGVRERDLTGDADDQPYRYRYTNLRLLIQGDGAMFLVPGTRTPAATTIMLPLDDAVHVQFQHRAEPP